jgi:UDP-N-acetylglucosamine diphosphorylase/glucosamine-1-phosphate N-acetyltransferase
MPAHPIIIFDDGAGQLGPMTDTRATFEVRTGMFTTAGRIAAAFPRRLGGCWVPARLQRLVAERCAAPVNALPPDATIGLVNGRWLMPDPGAEPGPGEALVEEATGAVIAATLPRDAAEAFLSGGGLPEGVVRRQGERALARYPWDVIAAMQRTIAHDILSTRVLAAQVVRERADVVGEHPVEVHESATLFPQVVFDATQGPIIVHEKAVLRPGAILCGPCSVGQDSVVLDRAIIKPNTVIGRGCKVGGEVGATIFQGFANKAHHGHLGDSWVGEWVNFGAGATNSNLLNTYSEVKVRVEPDGGLHATGLTFLGAVVGDHAKFAINSSIMTGTVVGTGAMVACTAPPPQLIRRFAWITNRGEQRFRFERFLETARAMMARRQRQPSEPYTAVLRQLHESAPHG